MESVANIRKVFLDYFKNLNHEIISSSHLVPNNDPSLMFVNSGMVQFKNVFTGQEVKPYNRAASSQKCVRAGGKHNDLENVGYTSRHHTFFEMLGNFSFGDYFKEDAIAFSWNLITKDLGISKDKLLVTVYSEDIEAKNLWKKISGLSEKKIISISSNDNFWSMGDTGPCGPCSEIFYDHGEHIFGGPPGSKDEDGDRFVEIWNLVFMQFEQINSNKRINLPKPSIDTGMGLERVAAVLQGTNDNYEIDLINSIIKSSAEFSNTDFNGDFKISHRVIADHLRASSFLIAEGVLPDNEGRGYVLRRIMRRAMRHAHIMGCKDPLMYKLVPSLLSEMGEHFSELINAKKLISDTLFYEESKFKETLDRGLKILNYEASNLSVGDKLDGKIAFKLYDTYGFPFDLTEDILKSQKLSVDKKSFDLLMNDQRKKAKSSWSGSGDNLINSFWIKLSNDLKETEFLGYKDLKIKSKIEKIVLKNQFTNTANINDEVEVILNKTSFYAESGGQESDSGYMYTTNFKASVNSVWKTHKGIYIHKIKVLSGKVNIQDEVNLEVNPLRRSKLSQNHTSTHILHQVLKDVLGDHVNQKGSLVSEDKLRFDFSQNTPISSDQIILIEKLINSYIRNNSLVKIDVKSLSDAQKAGATALFGEKYGEKVRVVSFGNMNKNAKRSFWSMELCGGTHVSRLGEIGFVKILNESSISSGVRRIEAVSAENVLSWIYEQKKYLDLSSNLLKTNYYNLSDKVQALINENKKLKKDLKNINLHNSSDDNNFISIGNISFLGKILINTDPRDLKGLADKIKKNLKNSIIALISKDINKVSIVVSVTKDICETHSALEIIKFASNYLGGKGGGGRNDMAQSGGTKPDNSEEAINNIIKFIKNNS